MNPLTEGTRLKLGYDYFSEGFTGLQLSEAYYRLSADKRQERLLFETATMAQMDEVYNPGDPCDENDRMETTEGGMVFESIRVKAYARTEKTMAALVRVFNTHLADKNIEAQAPIVGRPKKSGLFATVTVQIPFSDGQTVSIIFHSPDNNKMKIAADDEIIAFRWLLNKRDITHVVSPEGDAEVSLQEIGKRTAQLVEKNSARFQVMQKDLVAQKKTLEDVTAKAGEAVALHDDLIGKLQDANDATATTDAKIVNLKDRIEKQKAFNEGLQGKIDALQAKQAGNDGKAPGGGTPKDEAAMKAEQVAEYYRSKCAAFQDELRGRGFAIGDKTDGVLAFYQNPALQVSLGAARQAVFIEVIESDASGQTIGRKNFDSKTIKGMGSQVPKALAWIDKKLAVAKDETPLAPAEEAAWRESGADDISVKAIAKAGGYAAIMADEAKQIALQDILDSAMTERTANVRNALSDSGWDTNDATHMLKTINGEMHDISADVKAVGAGNNIISIAWDIDRGESKVEDDMSNSAADMASVLNGIFPAEMKKTEPIDTYLPAGWTESSPGGLATSKDPISGGMIDKEIASGKWFVIPENGSIQKMEGFSTRKEAFDALEHMAASAASDKAVEEHNRLVAVGNGAVPGVRLQDAEIAGKLWEMKGRGELSQEDWDKYVADLKASNKIIAPEPTIPGDNGDRKSDWEKKPPYDDEYTGQRFKYGFRNRPYSIGTAPKGAILGSYKEDDKLETSEGKARFGTIEYPFKLTTSEIYSYELLDLNGPVKTAPEPAPPNGPQALTGSTMTPEDEQRVLAELSALGSEELSRRHDEVRSYMEGPDFEAQDPAYKKSLQNTEFLLFTAKSNASTPEPAPADTAESALVQRANDILAGKYDSLSLGEVLKLAEPVMDLDEAKYADLMDKVDAYTTVLTKKAVQAKLAA